MIRIVPFTAATRDHVRKLNYEWLEKYFTVEPNDALHLSDPETYIIARGGDIFYAEDDGEIIGTYSLLKLDDGIYELGKMATTASAQGKGIGKMMISHCIDEAKRRNAKKLILFSNTKLEPAIHLYRKFGFREIPLENSTYVRSNIKMELDIMKN